ncbi:hypothetical protein [Oceanobacillus halophilus]|uniref:Uncharacterized protein n=1 Tax=Oceanobacillus halophilus TaxID=930130 RepID=A0A494ZZE0_9BACI|nr:hypothetical protein [Oceanobacillus halophilus]RKQ32277.1 hypothetical protein D8M06_12905 [Oceanobacillus halophilus]
METKRYNGSSVIFSILGSFTAGYVFKRYLSPQQSGTKLLEKLKAAERKLYLDGKKRADIFKDLKEDLETR